MSNQIKIIMWELRRNAQFSYTGSGLPKFVPSCLTGWSGTGLDFGSALVGVVEDEGSAESSRPRPASDNVLLECADSGFVETDSPSWNPFERDDGFRGLVNTADVFCVGIRVGGIGSLCSPSPLLPFFSCGCGRFLTGSSFSESELYRFGDLKMMHFTSVTKMPILYSCLQYFEKKVNRCVLRVFKKCNDV